MDIGYSGDKGFCPNSYFCIPSYAQKLTGPRIVTDPEPEEILFKDNITGELWLVGAIAQNNISMEDTKNSEGSLYGRNRYFDPMFKVIASVGMGLGLTPNEIGSPEGKEIYLQTGLPPAYLKSDEKILRKALSGTYDFSMKFGKADWREYKFELPPERIEIMSQPKGTLYSICVDADGKLIPEAKLFMKKNTLIFDPGFGTLDIFPIIGGTLQETQTFENLGMREILKRTADRIYEKYDVEVRIPQMQKLLEEEKIRYTDIVEMKTDFYTFDELLEMSSREVCMEALERTKQLYNYFKEIDFFVNTGGTGAAWHNYICEHLKGMTTPATPGGQAALTIVKGNKNDEIDPIFANARGYYFTLVQKLMTQKKQEK